MVRSTIQRLGSTTNLPTIAPLDDLQIDPPADLLQPPLEFRSLIAAIGIEFEQKWEHSEQRAHQHHTAVAILNIGGMDDGAQQQALRVYQDMALLAVDLLARVVTGWVDRAPPFSALLTLWLSMIAAVGLASRSASSRHST